jgi:hypothetical protein
VTDGVRVFVNERVVIVVPGATIREAVMTFDPALASALREGRAYVTDGVGRPVEPSGSVEPGAILRVVISSRGGPQVGG